jgi:hypothetical protein
MWQALVKNYGNKFAGWFSLGGTRCPLACRSKAKAAQRIDEDAPLQPNMNCGFGDRLRHSLQPPSHKATARQGEADPPLRFHAALGIVSPREDDPP